ncbi:MAG: hypothetical protein AB1710_09645 [Pseudomonadota bacterium]
MKNVPLLLISALFASGIAASAAADQYREGRDERPRMGMDCPEGMKCMGKHSMTGTIKEIDPKTGTLAVKTEAGDLRLHFPPSSLKDLKVGDTITVHMSFSKGKSDGMGH